MGILDALKRLFSSKPEDSLPVEKMDSEKIVRPYLLDEQKNSVEQQSTTDEPVDEHLKHDFEADLAKIRQERQSTVQHEPTKLKLQEEASHIAIKQWEDTIKAAQQHPLSQVKIINSQILEELNHVLKSMDHRLEKLNDLEKLDFILDLLQRTKDEIAEKGVSSQTLDSAITHISQLTIKDKEVIDWVGRQERVTANQLADYINLSRSTASFRLNRLAELGALEKEAIGKKIYYKIKKG
ncbi:MAG: helix-turn-helix domain-containing protein [Candidatus Nanoarchaeia archaeon]|nr:helix-turn-helix domain-containing protein [Candidatus Nanoarchaeia archaeon]